MALLQFKYNEDLIDLVKAFGGQWDRSKKEWYLHDDNLFLFMAAARKEFPQDPVTVADSHVLKRLIPQETEINEELRQYQREGVIRALTQSNQLFAYEMGLGKTATTLETIRQQFKEDQRILIVTTGINRHTWQQQFNLWWPDFPSDLAQYTPDYKAKLKKGKVEGTSSIRAWITSYNLLGDFLMTPEERGFEVLPPAGSWDYVVFDEGHYLSNYKSGRHKDAARLVYKSCPQAFILTGTPARDRLYDIHGLLKIIQPDHWGGWHSFIKRYCKLKANEYSEWNIVGMNEEQVGELQLRLGQIMHRVTKNEVKDQLPSFSFIPVTIEPKKMSATRLEDIQDIESWMLKSGYNKVDYTVDWVKEYVADPNNGRLCVVMYHYEVADKVYERLKDAGLKREIFYANGRQLPEDRIKEINRSLAVDNALLLVTMESIKTGINELKSYSRVLYGELHWSPEVVTQSMARFHRLDSPEPVEVYGIIMRGTNDEKMSRTLSDKMNEIDQIVISGSLEDKLRLSLIQDKYTPEQLNSAWTAVRAVEVGDYD